MTSPGVEALREAARLETARVYGAVQHEHVNGRSLLADRAEAALKEHDDRNRKAG